jgi:hypothetical protein
VIIPPIQNEHANPARPALALHTEPTPPGTAVEPSDTRAFLGAAWQLITDGPHHVHVVHVSPRLAPPLWRLLTHLASHDWPKETADGPVLLKPSSGNRTGFNNKRLLSADSVRPSARATAKANPRLSRATWTP